MFIPSWWMEYGMAIEPSELGAKIKFWKTNTPSEQHTFYNLDDIDRISEYEIEADSSSMKSISSAPMKASEKKQSILSPVPHYGTETLLTIFSSDHCKTE